ncbi:MAG: hypothetical protein QXK31_07000, partial [Fervidicoccaceae archaeon]
NTLGLVVNLLTCCVGVSGFESSALSHQNSYKTLVRKEKASKKHPKNITQNNKELKASVEKAVDEPNDHEITKN